MPHHTPVRFSLFLITADVVIVREEDLGGAETHEMGSLGPHISSVTSPLRSVTVSAGQDINDEAQSVVSQPEGVAFSCLSCLIPR
jgi:hypothetical protein